jgi:hypothetical protein
MFSLIISIIAIALVAALAGASVYYGGAAFTQGGADAEVASFKNAGIQLSGAYTLSDNNGDQNVQLEDLVPAYVIQVPSVDGTDVVQTIEGGNDASDAEGAYITRIVSKDVCNAMEDESTGGSQYSFIDFLADDALFGCYSKSNGSEQDKEHVIFYKVRSIGPAEIPSWFYET